MVTVARPSNLRIVVADDHPIFREGLVLILNNQPDMQVIGECGDGPSAVALCLELSPDLAILDLQMPGMNGASATAAILSNRPEIRVLLLTTFDGSEDIHRSVQAGARGYLLKDAGKQEVLQAIREVAQGRRYVSPSAGAALASSFALQQLTRREREVLRLLSEGKANKEIAAALHISEGTVKSHVTGIMQKLDAGSRTEAALFAQQHGLLRS